MHQVNMHEAKSNLSKLANLAQSGEKVVIAKSGKPYVELDTFVPKKQEDQPAKEEEKTADLPF